MSKLDKLQQGRSEGMDYALRIAKKDGIEGLEKEIKKRGITGISINMSHNELEKATENMRNMMFDTFMCFTLGILHDVYGFGGKRAQQFIDKFMEGAKLMEEGVITWQQIIENANEVLGKELSIRYNEKDTKLEREY